MTPVEELFQLLWDTPQDKLTWFAIKKRMLEKEKESHKENYIAGYLDNGYYEGAEEDAAKLWEETYGFNYNETFNTEEK